MRRKRLSDQAILTMSMCAALGIAVIAGVVFYAADTPIAPAKGSRHAGRSQQKASAFEFRVPRVLGGSVLPLFRGELVVNSAFGAVIRVTNNTGMAISRAELRVTRTIDGRSVPLSVETFGRSPDAGIEPGETLDWSFYRDRTDIPNAPEESKCRVTVEAIALYDAKGKLIEEAKDSH